MNKSKWGFTLIELIIVIVIVGILAAVALPKYFSKIDAARIANMKSDLRSVRDALVTYSAANNGIIPANTAAGSDINVVIDNENIMGVRVPATCNATDKTVTCTDSVTAPTMTYVMDISSGEITP